MDSGRDLRNNFNFFCLTATRVSATRVSVTRVSATRVSATRVSTTRVSAMVLQPRHVCPCPVQLYLILSPLSVTQLRLWGIKLFLRPRREYVTPRCLLQPARPPSRDDARGPEARLAYSLIQVRASPADRRSPTALDDRSLKPRDWILQILWVVYAARDSGTDYQRHRAEGETMSRRTTRKGPRRGKS